MNNKIFMIILLLFVSTVCFAKKEMPDIFTTLVIVEEQENGVLVSGETPFSNGVFNALWDLNEYIFFDMTVDTPLKKYKNSLDVRPFLEVGQECGADSILLIKFNYTSSKEGEQLKIKTKEVSYNLYSMNKLAVVRKAHKRIGIDKLIDKASKNVMLTNYGTELLLDIFN